MDSTMPRMIHLETPGYVVRTLETADATDNWRRWLTDPSAARNLNVRPAEMSAEDLRGYIEKFDRATAHLLGIFEKRTSDLVGIRAVYVDWQHREFLVNVLIGDAQARDKGARTQSRRVVYDYFFDELDLLNARSSVLAVNEPVIAGMAKRGWVHEHTSYKPAADGAGFVEVRDFRLPREAWRKLRTADTGVEIG
jgi:RimJ/RimL family protein N-acetyltransferase